MCIRDRESDGRAILRRDDRLVETRVTLGDLSNAAISAYVASGEPFDKAGGYGMQGRAMPFVTRIEGDPSNVIGLPLWTVGEMLAGLGLPLWSQWPDNKGRNPDIAAPVSSS